MVKRDEKEYHNDNFLVNVKQKNTYRTNLLSKKADGATACYAYNGHGCGDSNRRR